MSTNLHLRCVSHDPPIRSDDVGSSTGLLDMIRNVIRNRSTLVAIEALARPIGAEVGFGTRTEDATMQFLIQHPTCDIEIWDEYGNQHSAIETRYVAVEEKYDCPGCAARQ